MEELLLKKIILLTSGHTHGGQVALPYFTKKLLPNGSDQFIKGFYDMQAIGADTYTQMYVKKNSYNSNPF